MPLNRIPMDMVEGLMSNLADIAPQLLTKYDSYKVAVSGGYDWAPAITQAINDANTNLGSNPYAIVFVPVGTYDYYSAITVKANVVLVGTWGSTFNAKSNNNAFTFINNSGSYNISYVNTFSTTRQSAMTNHMLVANGSGVWLEKNRINGSASAGIMISSASDCKIYKNLVINTLADGIHTTSNSSHIRVEGNICQETGDDAFAVVSYQSDSGQCSYVEIVDNYTYHSKSRGVAVVGGNNVLIQMNRINTPTNAGVYLAYESSYNTYGVDQIDVLDNIIYSANSYNQTTNYGGIHVTSTSATYPVTNVKINRNKIINARWRGISLGASSTTNALLQNITVEENKIFGNTSAEGINFSNVQNLTIKNNHLRNVGGCGIYDSLYNNGTLIITHNILDNLNTSQTASTFGINIRSTSYSSIKVTDNTIIDNNNYLTRTISIGSQTGIIYERNNYVGGNKVDVIPDLTTYAPSYVGQIFCKSGVAYMGTGVSATTDWKQVS